MKKTFKTLGVVLGLPFLYLIIASIPQIIYTSTLLMKSHSTSFEAIQSELMSNAYVLGFFGNIIMLFLLYLICLATNTSLMKRCNFRKIDMKNIFYILSLSIGLSVVISILATLLSTIFPSYNDVSNLLSQTQSSVFKLILVIIFAPIFEEIFFRGVIFGFLRKNYNIVFAIILQAIIFALLHGNIVQGIYTFILGVALAVLYLYSNSLWGCILCHVVVNLFGVLILPKLAEIFPYFTIPLIILAIVCIIFSSIKMINKKNHICN